MLRASNLTCGYVKCAILGGVNFEVPAGQILTFIGLNGSGKTTLLKTLLGLINPLSGLVLVNQKPLASLLAGEKSQLITMLEADPSTHFAMSVAELFQIRRHQADKNYFDECLRVFEIEDLMGKNMLELSSGQAKRVWLAHLFSLKSKVIIIDEPFAHLDWAQQRKLCKIIKRWQRDHGTTFVLAAHELELIANLSDRLAVVAEKTLLKTGPPEEVLTSRPVAELFAFKALMDQNPIDGTKRLTLGEIK